MRVLRFVVANHLPTGTGPAGQYGCRATEQARLKIPDPAPLATPFPPFSSFTVGNALCGVPSPAESVGRQVVEHHAPRSL